MRKLALVSLTHDDLTLLSDAPVRVSAYVIVPYVTTRLRTPAQLERAVTDQSTTNHDGSFVVPETIDIGGLLLTPAKDG
jgi:hypothetical protein